MKSIFYRLACGIAIGIGGVLPGVSGGILAISLGIYEKMMLAVGSFFTNIKANVRYLLPLVIGGGIGILLTSNVLDILIERYAAQLLSLFCGLVLGSVPELAQEVRRSGPIKPRHILSAALGLLFVLLFAFGESSATAGKSAAELTIPVSLLSGAVLALGVVIPGISSSFILIYMGLYSAVIGVLAGIFDLSELFSGGFAAAITRFSQILVPLIFMTIGFGVCALLIIKLVNFMMRRHHAAAYAAIVGFVIGSVALIVPQIAGGFTWGCIPMFLGGVALSWLQNRFQARLTLRESATALPEAAVSEADGGER